MQYYEGKTTNLTENGCSKASDNTARQRDPEIGRIRERALGLLRHRAVDCFVAELVHGELTNGVGDLPKRCVQFRRGWLGGREAGVLAQNGQEASVKLANAAFSSKACKTRHQAGGISALRDQANAGRLQGGQKDIREEPNRQRYQLPLSP